jgi:hypothetical protein
MSNPYCTPADTQRHLVSLAIDDTTDLRPSDVAQFQDELAAEVNGVLRAQKYPTVPATGANDVLLIGGLIAQKAAARVWRAFFQHDRNLPEIVKTWDAEYERCIDRLSTGKQVLMDQAPAATTSGQIRAGRMRFQRTNTIRTEWSG